MAEVKFNLRESKSKNETLIVLSYSYNSYRLRMSTDRSVDPKNWNPRKQRMFERKDLPEYTEINNHLQQLSTSILKKYDQCIREGVIPTPTELKKLVLLSEDITIPLSTENNFWDLFEIFLLFKEKDVKDVTDYDLSLRKHIVSTELFFKEPITFEGLKKRTESFFEKFEHYLIYEAINIRGSKGMALNTVGKQMKNLKVFLHWCFDNNHIEHFSLKHLISRTEDVETVFLTELDLKSMRALKLDPEKSVVRDLFLIGCETGLRFSDFTRLVASDFGSEFLKVRPKKTSKIGQNNLILIPISSNLKKIIAKYDGVPPRFRINSLNTFNTEIREICKQAGITEIINVFRFVAGKETRIEKEKWQFVSSHTCRRTFCTLKFLAGMPAQAIMKFSGHKTERNFLRYLRLDAQLNAEHYKSFFK
jgi:integrase